MTLLRSFLMAWLRGWLTQQQLADEATLYLTCVKDSTEGDGNGAKQDLVNLCGAEVVVRL